MSHRDNPPPGSVDDMESRVRDRQGALQAASREIAEHIGFLVRAASADGLKRTAAAKAVGILGEGSKAASLVKRLLQSDPD